MFRQKVSWKKGTLPITKSTKKRRKVQNKKRHLPCFHMCLETRHSKLQKVKQFKMTLNRDRPSIESQGRSNLSMSLACNPGARLGTKVGPPKGSQLGQPAGSKEGQTVGTQEGTSLGLLQGHKPAPLLGPMLGSTQGSTKGIKGAGTQPLPHKKESWKSTKQRFVNKSQTKSTSDPTDLTITGVLILAPDLNLQLICNMTKREPARHPDWQEIMC